MDTYLKELETALKAATDRFHEDMQGVRSNRPSVGLVENIPVEAYGEQLTIKQVGSLSVRPPRDIEITLWDTSVTPAVMKAIEDSKSGLSVSNSGNIIRASLPQLTDERRAEIEKMVRKMSETTRIEIRTTRDETMKRIKAGEEAKAISEDQAFKGREQAQKLVDEANKRIEQVLEKKLTELGE